MNNFYFRIRDKQGLLLCLLPLFLFSCRQKHFPDLTDGVEIISANNVYVVHSLIFADDKPWTTSNIYVIRGTGDTIWIFGSGYGDFTTPCEDACNDNNYYLGMEFRGTGPATEDVRPIDSLIQNVWHLSRDSAVLQFIVPHYHNDHINEEFIDAFYSSFQYPMRIGEQIWIHANDSAGAVCNEPCCGTQPCPDKKNKYYGVPYLPAWKPEYVAMFKSFGHSGDACNDVVKTFTSTLGEWTITKSVAVKDKGHTDGTVNLNNTNLKLRIAGTKSKVQCELPAGWKMITVHDNIN